MQLLVSYISFCIIFVCIILCDFGKLYNMVLLFSGLSSIVFALNIDKLEFNKDVLDLTLNEPIIDGGNSFCLSNVILNCIRQIIEI